MGTKPLTMPLIIGLTGGIGSGKSTAARMFRTLGATVIDTDDIAHTLTGPRGRAVPLIREQFGADYVRPDRGLDRERMRETVFADSRARRRLEDILHPMIREEVERMACGAATPYVVLVVPLLFEKPSYRTLVQRIAVVDCEPEMQAARAMARSDLTRETVEAIMATQLDRAARLAQADDVLDNSGHEPALAVQVKRLHALYSEIAHERKGY